MTKYRKCCLFQIECGGMRALTCTHDISDFVSNRKRLLEKNVCSLKEQWECIIICITEWMDGKETFLALLYRSVNMPNRSSREIVRECVGMYMNVGLWNQKWTQNMCNISLPIYLQIVFQNCYVHHLRLKRQRFIRISEIDSIWRVYAVSFFIFMHDPFAIIMMDLFVFIWFLIAKTKSYLWIWPIF